ncbi:hypothetical protein AOXY_G20592 [Acipenser oxyrinchus oxyrinchus]|uniref:EF-hand domain-containing protein n=1 Tax=Acipenser oxyrinchus oxyrinchus TaxID=40147 RepID=A0AAD8D107_ACIOX|nr:hypothetical protein AOXY_G20592 [Acipenser oxyrinchus oxyrinchus]
MEKEEEKQDCDSTQDLESKKEDDKSTIGDGSDIKEKEPVCTVLDSTKSASAHKTQCPQEPKKQKKVAYTVETKTESEESKTVNAAASRQHGRRKSSRLTPKDIRRKASIKYSKHGPGTKTKNELEEEEEEEEDEEDEDAGCSSAEWRSAKTGGKARQLTEQQIKAFREVFGLFDRNSENCVNAPLLGSRLKDLGLSVGEEELKMAVQSADIDGDGMVSFEDFLAVVTDFRRFSQALNVSSNFAKEVHSKDVVDTVFYTVITKMIGMGALSHKQTGEIVRYYHAMFMRTLKKKLMKLEGDHVIGDYSKGASLMGLTDKQLLKYLKPLCGSPLLNYIVVGLLLNYIVVGPLLNYIVVGPLLNYIVVGPLLNYIVVGPLLNYIVVGPLLNYIVVGPLLNYIVVGPLLNYIVVGPLLNYIVVGPLLNYIVVGPLLNYIVVGPLLNYIVVGPLLNYIVVGPLLNYIVVGPLLNYIVVGPLLNYIVVGPLLNYIVVGPLLNYIVVGPLLNYIVVGPLLNYIVVGPLLNYIVVGPLLNYIVVGPLLNYIVVGPLLNYIVVGPLLNYIVVGPLLNYIVVGPLLNYIVVGPLLNYIVVGPLLNYIVVGPLLNYIVNTNVYMAGIRMLSICKSCSPYSVLPCLTAEAQPKRLLRKSGLRHPALNPEGEPGGHISLHRKNTVGHQASNGSSATQHYPASS